MKLLLPWILLAAAGLAGCNASLVEGTAPELVSTSWVLPEAAARPELADRWRLYAFFAPT